MKERRSSERKRPANYIAVVNRETNEPIGCLVDLTIDGMRIMNNKPIEEGILLKLRITINDSEYVFLDARHDARKPRENQQADERLCLYGIVEGNAS